QRLSEHISKTWRELTRSVFDRLPDPKIAEARAYLYIPQTEDRETIKRRAEEQDKRIEIRVLPEDPARIDKHGLLYLPNDYVVPGGRFNEMYGWDSYWIVLGLLRDNHFDLAKGMVENCFYQIENYGAKILNANRTYYLQRSQPPLLGPMVRAIA